MSARCVHNGDQSRSLDVSEAMLRSARASLARFNLAARIVLRNGEATAFDPGRPFAVHGFGRVFISCALS
ncbi:MAG: class I SAM-dependent methyltransferase, partial [Rhodomicrobium sp.]